MVVSPRRSGLAVELAFLGDPLVRLRAALDAVLPVVARGRQQLGDLEDAAAAVGSGAVEHALPDLELVIAHVTPPGLRKSCAPRRRGGGRSPLLAGNMANPTTEGGRWGRRLRYIVGAGRTVAGGHGRGYARLRSAHPAKPHARQARLRR